MTLPQPRPSAGTVLATLEEFFHQVLAANPFTANRVNGPSATDVDVDTIHRAAFEQVTALAAEAGTSDRGLGAVLWGEAGIGKSHLLARLNRWAEQDNHACFVYLYNLQASPDNLPRSLLKAVISTLTRGRTTDLHRTPLFQLVLKAVHEALDQDTSRIHPWPDVERAVGRLVDRLAQAPARAALVHRPAYDVLFRFFRAACRDGPRARDHRLAALALCWLGGDSLDPAEACQLGLPPARDRGEPVALGDNQEIKQVLVALSELARYRRQPLLLCLDQVDNLDDDQVTALARFLEAVIDSAPNLLAVTAGVQQTLFDFRQKGLIQASAWDRLAQFEIGLHRVTVAEGRQIVAARLKRFLEPFHDLEPVRERLRQDPFFPLGVAWSGAYFGDKSEVRPRDVLTGAREGWRRQQAALRADGGPAWLDSWTGLPPESTGRIVRPPFDLDAAIDRKVAQKMDEHQAQRRAEPHTLPPDANNLSGLVQALLEQCVRAGGLHGVAGVEWLRRPRSGPPPAVHLLVRLRPPGADREMLAGLLFVATGSATSAAAFLRRLAKDKRPFEHILLVTDQRQPLPLGERGQEYLAALRGRHRFQQVELTFDEYAALDALKAVIGLARSGDLEVEVGPGQVRRVTEAEVIASHQRRGRYLAAAVLRDLFANPAPPVKHTVPVHV
jgi:hypothetical protein